MNKPLERELKRGTLELVLLRVLSDHPTHGYDLVGQLGERSNGEFRMKDGTLYPVLYRLEDAGLITPEWDQPEAETSSGRGRGVPRKIYRLTDAGRDRLEELIAAWRTFSSAVDLILGGRSTDIQDPFETKESS